MDINKLKSLYEKKAKTYEHLGKEHLDINIEKKYMGIDICSHLHCEIVEFWTAVKLNQSIEQVIDELADILCIWNLALVLYQDLSKREIEFETIIKKSTVYIKNGSIIKLNPETKKEWNIKEGNQSFFDSLLQDVDNLITDYKIGIVYNFGQKIEIDIFGLLHNSANNIWNSIRKNKNGHTEIFDEIIKFFATWLIAVKLVSNYFNKDISLLNIIEISDLIFTKVAKKKFGIDI